MNPERALSHYARIPGTARQGRGEDYPIKLSKTLNIIVITLMRMIIMTRRRNNYRTDYNDNNNNKNLSIKPDRNIILLPCYNNKRHMRKLGIPDDI